MTGPGSRSSGRVPRLAAIATVLLVSLPLISSADVVTAASPPVDAPPVSLVGDSTMAGMAWNSTTGNDPRDIVGNSYRLTFDAESCRRLVQASCRGRFGTVPLSVLPLMRSTLNGRLGEAMVVMAGYDDAVDHQRRRPGDGRGRSAGRESRLLADLSHQHRVRVARRSRGADLYSSHNSELAAAAKRHPSLKILDWDAFTVGQSTWFAADGIHLNLAGAVGLANFIKEALDAMPSIGRCRVANALTGSVDRVPAASGRRPQRRASCRSCRNASSTPAIPSSVERRECSARVAPCRSTSAASCRRTLPRRFSA